MTAWSTGAPVSTASFLVCPNGAVTVAAPAEAPWLEQLGFRPGASFLFGLPEQPPTRQWREDDRWPICHTEHEKDGIRYTQTVLVTQLDAGSLLAGRDFAPKSVLLVHIAGENTATEYTEASAAFSLESGGRPLELILAHGLIYTATTNRNALAAVEVPSTGIAGTNGPQLHFRGSMPPGTTGSMTIKIPLFPCPDDQDWETVRDLDFGAELLRVKRFWSQRGESPAPALNPVAFAHRSQ
jgi:hypothetical protein